MKKNYLFLVLTPLIISMSCSISPENESSSETAETRNDSIPVEAVISERVSINKTVRAAGSIQGDKEVYVISETQGKIIRDNFSLGQYTKRGSLLTAVKSHLQKAGVEQAEKEFEGAELHLNVTEQLYEDSSCSKADLIEAQNRFKGTKAALASAKEKYQNCFIKAPISGYIAEKPDQISYGNSISGGTRIARIVSIFRLKTSINVGETEVVNISKDDSCSISIPAISDTVIPGKVDAVSAGSDPATGSFEIIVSFSNLKDNPIKSGMSAEVIIHTKNTHKQLMVPVQAITLHDNKDAVIISKNQEAHFSFIKTGNYHGNRVEVLSGLSLGDTVITSGMTNLSQGTPVKTEIINTKGDE